MGRRKEKKDIQILCWGMGNKAREFIGDLRSIKKPLNLVGVTSSIADETRIDYFEGVKVISLDRLSAIDIDYICILGRPEWAIRRCIYSLCPNLLDKTITYEELMMMNAFSMDIYSSYDRLLKLMPMDLYGAIHRRSIFEDLKRKYASFMFQSKPSDTINTSLSSPRCFDKLPVWVCWLQGRKNAPEVVQVCINSIAAALSYDEELVLLDENNIFSYVDFPEYIVEKWKKGTISNTHFSDLLRLRLLNTYGGIWIDSTVFFMSEKMPEYIRHRDFFIYFSDININRYDPHIFANWFIKSYPNNELLEWTEMMLWEYWKNAHFISDYEIMHIIMTLIVDYRNIAIPRNMIFLREPARMLLTEINDKYDAKRYREIMNYSSVQKLSYKVKLSSEKNTFWDYIRQSYS